MFTDYIQHAILAYKANLYNEMLASRTE
jgi:hypothetical protein